MLQQESIIKIKELIISAGLIAAQYHGGKLDVKIKNDNSPVTNVDNLLSTYIIKHLSAIVPNVPIISEEEDIIEYGEKFFLIDPIDGTKSYIKGENSYTVNIGLIENGLPTYGFIYQPSNKLLHYTDVSKKLVVEMDGRDVTLEMIKRHSRGCIITVSHRSRNSQQTSDFIIHNNALEVIEISSSIKLCMIADGSADLYPRFGVTMEWDIAAGHALILASGGDVLCQGVRMQYGKPELRNSDFVAHSRDYAFKELAWRKAAL